MPITKEQALAELQKRGAIPLVTKEQALAELQRRGMLSSPKETQLPPSEEDPQTFIQTATAETGALMGGIEKEGPELLGGIIGSFAGAPFFPPAGAIAGSGLGGALGKGVQQLAQGEFKPKQIAKAGARQVAYEVGGRGIAKGLKWIKAPVAKAIEPGLEKAEMALKKYMDFGMGFSPAQRSVQRVVDTLEEIAEKSFTGGPIFLPFRIMQKKGVEKFAADVGEGFASKLGRNAEPIEVGMMFTDVWKAADEAFHAQARHMYGTVDKLTKGAVVDIQPLKKFATEVMKTAEKRKGIGSTEAGDTLLKRVLSLDEAVSFEQAQSIRSGLLSEKLKLAIGRDKAEGLAKQFIKKIDEAMTRESIELSPEAYKAWRAANAFYREGGKPFKDNFIRRLTLNADPSVISKTLFRNENYGPIKTVRDELIKTAEGKETWKALKSNYVERLFTESFNEVDERTVGKRFVQKVTTMKDPTLKIIFTPDELSKMRLFGKVATRQQAPIGGGGGMLVQLMQAKGVMEGGGMLLATVGLTQDRPGMTAAGGAILIGPYVLARILTNPKTAKWLIEGFTQRAGTPAAIATATKILAAATQIELQRDEIERTKDQRQRMSITPGI